METDQTFDSASSRHTSTRVPVSSTKTPKLAPILGTIATRSQIASEHLLVQIDPNDRDLETVLLHAIESGMGSIARSIIKLKGAENSLPKAVCLLQSDRAKNFRWEGSDRKDTYDCLIAELGDPNRSPLSFDPENKDALQQAVTFMVVNQEDNNISAINCRDIFIKLDLDSLLMLALKHRRSKVAKLIIDQSFKELNELPTAFVYIQSITGMGRYQWDETNGYESVRKQLVSSLSNKIAKYGPVQIKAVNNAIKTLIESGNPRARTEFTQLLANESIVRQIDLESLMLDALEVKHGDCMVILADRGARNLIAVLFRMQSMSQITDQYVYNTWKSGKYSEVFSRMAISLIAIQFEILSLNEQEEEMLFKVLDNMIKAQDLEVIGLLDASCMSSFTEDEYSKLLKTAVQCQYYAAAEKLNDKGAVNLVTAICAVQEQGELNTLGKKFYEKALSTLSNTANHILVNDNEKASVYKLIVFMVKNVQLKVLEFIKNQIIISALYPTEIDLLVAEALESGMGSVAVLLVRIEGRQYLAARLLRAQSVTNWVVGSSYQFTAQTLVEAIVKQGKVEDKEEIASLQAAVIQMVRRGDLQNLLSLLNVADIKKHLAIEVLMLEAIRVPQVEVVRALVAQGAMNLAHYLFEALSCPLEDEAKEVERLKTCQFLVEKIEEQIIQQKHPLILSERQEVSSVLFKLTNSIDNRAVQRRIVVLNTKELIEQVRVEILILALNNGQENLARAMFKPLLDNKTPKEIFFAIHQVQVECIWEKLNPACQAYYDEMTALLKTPELFDTKVQALGEWRHFFMKVIEFIVCDNRLDYRDFFGLEHIAAILNYGQLLLGAIKVKKIQAAKDVLGKLRSGQEGLENILLSALEASTEVNGSLDKDTTLTLQVYLNSELRKDLAQSFANFNCYSGAIPREEERFKAVLLEMLFIGDDQSVVTLVEACTFKAETLEKLLESALSSGNFMVVKSLECKGAQLKPHVLTIILHSSAQSNGKEVCKHILDQDKSGKLEVDKTVDIDGQPCSLLTFTIKKGFYEISGTLLAYGLQYKTNQDYKAALAAEDERIQKSGGILSYRPISMIYTPLPILPDTLYESLKKLSAQDALNVIDEVDTEDNKMKRALIKGIQG